MTTLEHALKLQALERQTRDADWMRRIRAGDVGAFRALFEAYVPQLVRLAVGYTQRMDLAQDVVQDVFATIWQRRDQLQVTGSVLAYLTKATRNRALDALRAARRARHWEAAAVQEAELTLRSARNLGDERLDTDALQSALDHAVRHLPPRQREVFLLHREQGLDYPTIAATLEIGVPSVHNLMSKAMRRLHELLREEL